LSKLKVNKGIPQPEIVDNNSASKFIKLKRNKLTANDYYKGIINGDISVLGRAITIIESSLPQDKKLASQIIEKCMPYTGNSIRIGITGVPGVGKSTFIESFGKIITNKNKKLAVLAVDPSSKRSGGSILGDKTRMEELSQDRIAFIRPSPSAGSLGGVAQKSAETVLLCEAAGYEYILIETVGVGQSEVLVHSMVDFFLLLMLAGAGDELQGIKRGIMEMADMISITKADNNNEKRAKLAKAEYENALHLFPLADSGYSPKVSICSSIENTGIDYIYDEINNYIKFTKNNNFFYTKRKQQLKQRMEESINEALKEQFYTNTEIKKLFNKLQKQVEEGKINLYQATEQLLNKHKS